MLLEISINPGFLESDLFKWVVLPVLIFLARLCDVTLGTLRNVFISKGIRNVVPFVGFFEVLIWLISIRQIMQHLDNPMCYVGFASGFALGTYVGLKIEARLALGVQVLRIITSQDTQSLVAAMQKENMGTTIIDGHGAKGPVKIIFTIVKRKDIDLLRYLISLHCPQSFYSIEDIRIASQGVFPKGTVNSNALDYIKRIFPTPGQK